jgi:ADP-ribose pyrophosphatase YjhB (NUDIX family)
VRTWLAGDARHRYVCGGCGTIHYENPRVVVCAIVNWRERILFCRRSEDPGKGLWTLPLGFLECGETLEEGAARETFEETGVKIDPTELELSSIMNLVAIHQVAVSFRASCRERPTVCAGKECVETAFMSEKELTDADLAWACMSVSQFFAELRSESQSIKILTPRANASPPLQIRKYILRNRMPLI